MQALWLRLSVMLAILFALSFIAFVVLRSAWTCQYTPDVRLVIGSSPSIDLANYLATQDKTRIASCTNLLLDYGGDTERMYSRANLVLRFSALVVLFLAIWSTLAATVIAIGHGLAGGGSRRIVKSGEEA
ncbi:hypothetical protein BLA18112_00523 [Burkholderia lata]|uniref:Uncharacterized protein n=1 Tax=Burkholderia lata (strain ATCC 17760 / DSM 23089 / LMG 22485 / NCIMB 9086 / R18194 / 383) TaxID=482957 RepID=A0A6P2T2I0_BURL3|nr:hypothetical protein BLA18112_00523 [Burkholderia lata]